MEGNRTVEQRRSCGEEEAPPTGAWTSSASLPATLSRGNSRKEGYYYITSSHFNLHPRSSVCLSLSLSLSPPLPLSAVVTAVSRRDSSPSLSPPPPSTPATSLGPLSLTLSLMTCQMYWGALLLPPGTLPRQQGRKTPSFSLSLSTPLSSSLPSSLRDSNLALLWSFS